MAATSHTQLGTEYETYQYERGVSPTLAKSSGSKVNNTTILSIFICIEHKIKMSQAAHSLVLLVSSCGIISACNSAAAEGTPQTLHPTAVK